MLSIWEKESFFAPQDVVIIGSGFVGLWSAFYLKKKYPRLKITVLERGRIPSGASTRNAGFACFGSLSELVHDAQAMGRDKMLELVEMRFRGLERICKHFKKGAIDFERCGGYELYDPEAPVSSEQINHNIDYLNSLLKPITGEKKTYRPTDEAIGSFGFGRTKHLVRNKLEGFLHSGRLVQSLGQRVQGMGVQVLTNMEIRSFEKKQEDIELKTDVVDIRARKVLFCTNAFVKDLLPELDVVPARGQILLTSPISGLPWKGTFHSDEGFYYFRNLGERVLLGGARNKALPEEETVEVRTSNFIQSELEKYLDEVVLPQFRGQYTIEDRWAGIMAMGSEKMPIVKKLDEGIFCAVRMSGMGVALAPVVAEQVVALMKDEF
jgi:gamma-glutamylputrescine oxidase